MILQSTASANSDIEKIPRTEAPVKDVEKEISDALNLTQRKHSEQSASEMKTTEDENAIKAKVLNFTLILYFETAMTSNSLK